MVAEGGRHGRVVAGDDHRGTLGLAGQQQLFHLAMVLFRPSSVLLLDEPEQRLDTHKRELLTRLLVERKAAGTTLVIACHDPAMTEAVADRVIDVASA